LRQAVTALLAPGKRAVLGPADDGGYYLLGLQQAEPAMFADITWSTEHVATQTQQRAASIHLPMSMLPAWYDIDDPASLQRLTAEFESPGIGYKAPATRTQLATLRLSLAS
jgi:glycosyltransferase A (GT-A) superfamily protein (DUF2064 family)